MHRVNQLLVAACALAYTIVGIWTIVDPVTPMADVGLAPIDERGLVEIRAMYGGLELGMAAFLIWSLGTPQRTHSALVAGTLSIGGLGLARLLGTLAYQPEGWLFWGLCALELTGGVGGAVVLFWQRQSQPSTSTS